MADAPALPRLDDFLQRLQSDFDFAEVAVDALKPLLDPADCNRAVVCRLQPDETVAFLAEEGKLRGLDPKKEAQAMVPVLRFARERGRWVEARDLFKNPPDELERTSEILGAFAQRLYAFPCDPATAVILYGRKPGEIVDETLFKHLETVARALGLALELGPMRRERPELEQLRLQRTTDAETGLATGRALLGRLNEEVQRAGLYGRPVSLIMTTLDRPNPDLKAAAELLRKHLVPVQSAACRTEEDGTDAFYILLPETDRAAALAFAEKLRGEFETAGMPASFGLAHLPGDAEESMQVLFLASRALESARKKGNTVVSAGGTVATPGTKGRPLATREERALAALLPCVFESKFDLSAQLDLAARAVAAALEVPKAFLGLYEGEGWMAWGIAGWKPGEAEEIASRARAQRGREGDQLAVPLTNSKEAIGVLLVEKALGPYEESVVRATAARLSESLAGTARIEEERRRLRRDREETERAVAEVRKSADFSEIAGSGKALHRTLHLAASAAKTHLPVLISGESGTGKELIARAIHANSARRGRPMISLNCANLKAEFLESELFGHVKGAFTGAAEDREGLFAAGDGGTLFLDEVSEIPLDTQGKLLRAIQFGEFRRLGSNRPEKADVRIIAATNRDLLEDVAAGRFRQDLYHRLNVFHIPVPPLREHPEDIPVLVEHFCARHASASGKKPQRADPAFLEALSNYSFPGNIRELENILLRAIAMSPGPTLTLNVLDDKVRADLAAGSGSLIPKNGEELDRMCALESGRAQSRVERAFLIHWLQATGGKIQEVVKRTGVDRRLLYRMIARNGLRADDYR